MDRGPPQPLVTLECLIDAAVTLQLDDGNLRAVYQQEFRLLDDADRCAAVRASSRG